VNAVVLGACLQEDAFGRKIRERESVEEVVQKSGVHIAKFLCVRPSSTARLGLWLEVRIEEYDVDVLDFVLERFGDV
jgi:hypothetical protein